MRIELRIVDAIDSTIEPRSAGINPPTDNPGTKYEVNISITALITKANSPKVRRVKGKDTRLKIGLIKVFTTPRTIDARIAVVKLSTLIPGTI